MQKLAVVVAALGTLAFMAPAASAAGMSSSSNGGKYCLQGPGATKNCQYQTMAACEKDKKGSQQCAPNTSGTTGSSSSTLDSSTSSKGMSK